MAELWFTTAEEFASAAYQGSGRAALATYLDLPLSTVDDLISAVKAVLPEGVSFDEENVPIALGALLVEDVASPDDEPLSIADLPTEIDLHSQMPAVRNQGRRGTCVAYASAAVRELLLGGQSSSADLSEQFIYWACKQRDGYPGFGTWIHTAMAILQEMGVCPEVIWPYNGVIIANNEGQGPALDNAASEAIPYRVLRVTKLNATWVDSLREALAAGLPVAFSVGVYESCQRPYTYSGGDLRLPLPGEKELGGHAMCMVGYVDDDETPGGGISLCTIVGGKLSAMTARWLPDTAACPTNICVSMGVKPLQLTWINRAACHLCWPQEARRGGELSLDVVMVPTGSPCLALLKGGPVMADEYLFVCNGVDAETVDYLIPPMSLAELAKRIRRPITKAEAGAHQRLADAKKPNLGGRLDENLQDVKQGGWAVVFHKDEDSKVRRALDPLVRHRLEQIGNKRRVKVLDYAGESTPSDWLRTYGVEPGDIEPWRVPYYLLLVGGPERIPFKFSQDLAMLYAVGLLHFDQPADYRRYIDSLIAHERGEAEPCSREALFFRTQHDRSTKESALNLVQPLTDGTGEQDDGAPAEPPIADHEGFYTRRIWDAQATKNALVEVFAPGKKPRPAFLFTASHGTGRRQPTPEQWSGRGATHSGPKSLATISFPIETPCSPFCWAIRLAWRSRICATALRRGTTHSSRCCFRRSLG